MTYKRCLSFLKKKRIHFNWKGIGRAFTMAWLFHRIYINIESLYPFDGRGSEKKEWGNFDRHLAQANNAPTSGTGAKEFNGETTRNLSSWVVTYLYYGWRVSEVIRQRRQRLRRIIWNSVENNSGAIVRENEIHS